MKTAKELREEADKYNYGCPVEYTEQAIEFIIKSCQNLARIGKYDYTAHVTSCSKNMQYEILAKLRQLGFCIDVQSRDYHNTVTFYIRWDNE